MRRKIIFLLFLVFFINASAQWTYDPGRPLSITDKKDCGTILVKTHSSGVTYITYAVPTVKEGLLSSTYDLYITKLDVNGNKMWSQDVLISDKKTASYLSYSNMEILDDASVIICFYDYIQNEKWNTSVYKINQDGTLAWGNGNLQITSSSTTNNYPAYVMGLSDGSVIVSWIEGNNKLYLQKIKSDGSFAWATPKLIASSSIILTTGLCLADKDDNFYVTYADQRARAQYYFKVLRLDKDGNKLWTDPINVTNNNILLSVTPIPSTIVADGDGGIYVCLSSQEPVTTAKSVIYLQQISADGRVRYPGEGLLVANNTSKYFKTPVIYYHKDREFMVIAWAEANSDQKDFGLGIQKISLVSDRLEWGIEGKKLRKLITGLDISAGNLTMDDEENIYLTYQDFLNGSGNSSQIKVKKMDMNSFPVWEDDALLVTSKILVANVSSYKDNIVVVWKDANGELKAQKCKIGD